jgi:D-glycero-D-manno-heptose 1,7-bisphosphate phosphatase
MLVRAASDLDIDLSSSFVIGDKLSDLDAGRRAGCKTVLVLTGYGRMERRRLAATRGRPDCVATSILSAVPWILRQTPPERPSTRGRAASPCNLLERVGC